MTFVSLEFLIFFPIVIGLNYLLKGNYRNALLNIISIYFYLSIAHKYTIYLLVYIFLFYIISYLFTIFKDKSSRKLIFLLGIIISLFILLQNKYLLFFADIFIKTPINIPSMLNPFFFLGISYLTFQIIGYFIDIYYERIKPEKNLLRFALFLSFFPKIVAGPIERGNGFLQELKSTQPINTDFIIQGFKMFLWGYFAKVVISDRIAYAVNNIFYTPEYFSYGQILFGIILYTFQIYTDFMGYSFMALGSSQMLGYKIINNFHLPLFSQSISEFWKRWHISLSNWLRDYIFIPLSYLNIKIAHNFPKIFEKPENFSYILTTFITMTICGFWHGAKWTFIIWGMLHSLYMIISFITKKTRKKILKKFKINNNSLYWRIFRIVFTFDLITFAFLIFRADDLHETIRIIRLLFSFNEISIRSLFYINSDLYISIFSIIFLLCFELIQYVKDAGKFRYSMYNLINLPIIILLLILIIFFGKFGESDFIYFKF